MRRLDHRTKDIILWTRSATVQAREKLEFFLEEHGTASGGDFAEGMCDITERLLEGFRETLGKVLGIEVLDVLSSFDIPDGYVTKSGSAFPHLKEEGISFDESIIEYIKELIDSILDLPSLPAMSIIDEIEEWLNDLYDYHLSKRENAE
jgi:hypothetical protein